MNLECGVTQQLASLRIEPGNLCRASTLAKHMAKHCLKLLSHLKKDPFFVQTKRSCLARCHAEANEDHDQQKRSKLAQLSTLKRFEKAK